MGAGAVSFQRWQEEAPIHSFMRILEVQENQEKWILVNNHQLLRQIKPQYGLPCSPPGVEAM